MKIKGSELALWMDSGWPKPEDDWYWDHDLFDDKPDPEIQYDTDELGGVIYQGSGEDPSHGEGLDIGKLIRKWRKERDFDVLTITVSKGQTESVKAALTALGVEVT